MNHFRHANLQIGDKAFYTLKACDLKHVTKDSCLVKQQTSDNDNTEQLHELTEHAQYTSPPSESKTEGCCVHEVETANDSKNSSESTSTTSLLSSNKKEPTASDGNEASGVTVQVDIHEGHHTAGSDSAEGDEDSDGGETVTPKSKGAGSVKHDSGLSHTIRYPTKRRKKRSRRKRKTAPPLKVNVGDKVCVEVTHTCTTVDVIWQEGSTQDKILSTDLIPVFHLDELEFFPGDYVSDKRGENFAVSGVIK